MSATVRTSSLSSIMPVYTFEPGNMMDRLLSIFSTVCILHLLYQNQQYNLLHGRYPSVALPEPIIQSSLRSVSFSCSTRTHNTIFCTVCILQLPYQNPQYNPLYGLYPSVALPEPTIQLPYGLYPSVALPEPTIQPSVRSASFRCPTWTHNTTFCTVCILQLLYQNPQYNLL
jgi:hypothetical protein